MTCVLFLSRKAHCVRFEKWKWGAWSLSVSFWAFSFFVMFIWSRFSSSLQFLSRSEIMTALDIVYFTSWPECTAFDFQAFRVLMRGTMWLIRSAGSQCFRKVTLEMRFGKRLRSCRDYSRRGIDYIESKSLLVPVFLGETHLRASECFDDLQCDPSGPPAHNVHRRMSLVAFRSQSLNHSRPVWLFQRSTAQIWKLIAHYFASVKSQKDAASSAIIKIWERFLYAES